MREMWYIASVSQLNKNNLHLLSGTEQASLPVNFTFSCLSPGIQSAANAAMYIWPKVPWTKIFSSLPQGKILHARSSSAAGDILKSNLQDMDVNRKLAQPYDWVSLMSSTIFRKAYSPEELSYEHIILSWVFSRITKLCVCYSWRGTNLSFVVFDFLCWAVFNKMQKGMTPPQLLNCCGIHLSEDYQTKQWS